MYQTKDKEVKKRARADKRRTLERGEEKAERAAHQYNLKELYMKTKLLRDTSRSKALEYGLNMTKPSPQRKKYLKVTIAILYGAEMWSVTPTEIKRLDAFQRRCRWHILVTHHHKT